jgi:hypothetical protein
MKGATGCALFICALLAALCVACAWLVTIIAGAIAERWGN